MQQIEVEGHFYESARTASHNPKCTIVRGFGSNVCIQNTCYFLDQPLWFSHRVRRWPRSHWKLSKRNVPEGRLAMITTWKKHFKTTDN